MEALGEVRHYYGKDVHLLDDPYLLSLLSELCAPKTFQPLISELTTRIYRGMLHHVLRNEFSYTDASVPTRMAEFHSEAVYRGPVLDRSQKVVTVNLARAGTLPSQVIYHELNYCLDPALIRQDHIGISRKTNESHQTTGSLVSGHKIGGSVEQALVLYPDPMGATGGTIVEAAKLYQELGTAKKTIAMHCIVTPEYLKKVTKEIPGIVIYAVRLDRGLSSVKVLQSDPGKHWDEERGLNDNSYIVPGGGGFGEILNNAFV